MHELTLFYRMTCGYCLKVLRYIEENNISLTLKNITENSEMREELIAITGKAQVPCLIIDGKPLFESDDIIEWLDQNRSNYDNT